MQCFRRECPPTAHLLRQMGMAARPIYGHFFSLSLRWFCPELWSVLRKIARALKALPKDTVIDCEIVAFGDDCYTHASRLLYEGFVGPHLQRQDQQSSHRSPASARANLDCADSRPRNALLGATGTLSCARAETSSISRRASTSR